MNANNSAKQKLLSIRQVSKVYHQGDEELAVIKDLTVDLPMGESVAIVGRSGMGKSTLLHVLGALDRPSTGSVWYGDTDVFGLSDEARSAFRGNEIGFVFQFHHLLPEFTALENAAMPLMISGVKEREALDKAKERLAEVGLEHRLNHRPSQLSGGEQQRVAVARALITDPSVILADEPTGNLDSEMAVQVMDLLKGASQRLNALLVTVTHNRELAGQLNIVFEMVAGGGLRRLK